MRARLVERVLMTLLCAAVTSAALAQNGAPQAYVDIVPWMNGYSSRPLIPRSVPGVQWGSGFIGDPDSLLPGDNFANAFLSNIGDELPEAPVIADIYVDGTSVLQPWWLQVLPMNIEGILNGGPFDVRSGRHTVSMWLDSVEQITEQDETNNVEGHQWVWRPEILTAGIVTVAAGIPDRLGGWDHVVDGQVLDGNAIGYRYEANGWWQVVALDSREVATDLDLEIHYPGTGPQHGLSWDTRRAISYNPAGYTDFVVVNGNVMGFQTWDLAVTGWPASSASYGIHYVNSSTLNLGVPEAVTMGQDEVVLVREFHVGAGREDYYTIVVESADPAAQVGLHFYDATTSISVPFATSWAYSDADGRIRHLGDAPAAGWYGLVVVRDRDTAGCPPLGLTLEVHTTRPSIEYRPSVSWASVLVPRANPDATEFDVPTPVALYGDIAPTYLNLRISNQSPRPTGPFDSHLFIDNDTVPVHILQGDLGFFENQVLLNQATAAPVPGGRHALFGWLDAADQVYEEDELDNIHGEQWVWKPSELIAGFGTIRPVPAWKNSGVDYMSTQEPAFFVCDGVRTPVFVPGSPAPQDARWSTVAVLADPATDLDVQLHAPSQGPKDGFDIVLVGSYWPAGLSDFVLVDHTRTSLAQFDVGVINQGSAGGNYVVHTAVSEHHGGMLPFFTDEIELGPGEVVELHSFELEAGLHAVDLETVSGWIDWGLSIHGNGVAFASKSDVLDSGIAFAGSAGEDEGIQIDIPEDGIWCVAVWKADAADRDSTASCQLIVTNIGSPSDQPSTTDATRIACLSPNPFNPATTLQLWLQEPQEVVVEVFDLRGRRLRVLHNGLLSAGRQDITWDGRDDSGEPAASGNYFLKVRAGEKRGTVKAALVR